MCRQVVKSGKGKMLVDSPSSFSSLNIHLLYTDIEMEKRYLQLLAPEACVIQW